MCRAVERMIAQRKKEGADKPRRRLVLSISNGFCIIAAWQFAGFAILLLLVWANELIDLAAFFYGETPKSPDLLRAWLATAGVLLASVIVVGNTYLQHRAILAEVLTVCSYCHKIAVDREVWQTIEDHLQKNPMLKLTHGICPDCIEKVRATWEAEEAEARKT